MPIPEPILRQLTIPQISQHPFFRSFNAAISSFNSVSLWLNASPPGNPDVRELKMMKKVAHGLLPEFAVNVWRILKTIQEVGASPGCDRFFEFETLAALHLARAQG